MSRVEVRQWGPTTYGVYVHDTHSHKLGDFAGLVDGCRDDALAFGESVLRQRRNRDRVTVSARGAASVERESSGVVCEDVGGSAVASPSQHSHNLLRPGGPS